MDMQVGLAGAQFNVHDKPQANPGTCFYDHRTGKTWVYMKAGQNLVQGNPVTVRTEWDGSQDDNEGPLDDYFEAAVAGSTVLKRESAITTDLRTVLPGLSGSYQYKERPIIYAHVGTGHGQMGVIIGVRETELDVEWLTSKDGTLTTATADSTDWQVFAPYMAVLPIDEDQGVVGFVQVESVSEGEYFWVLQKGIGIGRKIVSHQIFANEALMVSDAGGSSPNGALENHSGNTYIEPVAYSMADIGSADSDTVLIPIIANGTLQPGTVPIGERWVEDARS